MPVQGAMHAQARLGRYELLARLAIGGMGEIFLARLEGAAGFEKLYVVKRILPHLADDARFRQMLIAEARIASKMSHANICQVYELGETDGQLYIVMEYLEGVTMLPLLRRAGREGQHLDFGFVAGVIQQVTDALHYAHELKDRNGENLGIIHRDVTPSNVFLTETGITKVLDFGIAKAKGASAKTEDGAVKGKYAYMAPEQLRGGAIDRRVDVFALGVVVYEMIALRRLFQRKTDYLTFRAVMEQPIPDVRRYRPDAPEPLAAALARALDREPETRFESARQLGTVLIGAMTPKPWTQGEIGDFVRANFADDIHTRSQQVSNVLHRTGAGAPARATMPVIAAVVDEEPTHLEEDSMFPSVETDVDIAPPFMPQPAPPRAGQSGDFIGGTPMPFGGSTGSIPALQPLLGQAPTTVIVHKRSMLWPMLSVAFLAVAGGALFLVWKQMENQQSQPAVVNITNTPAPAPAPTPTTGPGPTVVAPEPDPKRPVQHQPKRPVDPYQAAFQAAITGRAGAMQDCVNDHKDDGVSAAAIQAKIMVAANGHAKTVTLSPDSVNAAPVGACIRNALMNAKFPTSTADHEATVPLTLSPRRT